VRLLDGPNSERFALQIGAILREVWHVHDLPGPYSPADWRRWAELKRSVLHVLDVGTLTQRCHDPKAIVFSANQQTGCGLADACRIRQYRVENRFQFSRRRVYHAQYLGRGGKLFQSLPALEAQTRNVYFLASRCRTATGLDFLWSEALRGRRLAASRLARL
jgi:hypothetical protein